MINIPPQLGFDILKTALSWGIALMWFMKKEIILEITISIACALLLILKRKVRTNARKSYYRRKYR